MSDSWQTIFSPVEGLGQGSVNTDFTPTAFDVSGVPSLPNAVPGQLSVALLGTYVPSTTNDLVWTRGKQPTEMWPTKTVAEAIVNMGPHQVTVVDTPVVFDLKLHGARLSAWIGLEDNDGELDQLLEWDWDDGTVERAGLRNEHTYTVAGLYWVTVQTRAGLGGRWVRVFTDWDESDLSIVGIELDGSLRDGGWSATLTVAGDVSMLEPGTHLAIYARDTLDLAWRHTYDARMRALATRRMWNTQPPPDPTYQVDNTGAPIVKGSIETVDTRVGSNGFATGLWPAVDVYDNNMRAAADAFAVPVNLGKAMIQYMSKGKATWVGQTGSETCGLRQGLFGVHDCFVSSSKGINAFSSWANIIAGMRELRHWYNSCGSWWNAINGFLYLTCVPSGAFDAYGREDYAEVAKVMQLWKDLDATLTSTTAAEPALAYAKDETPGSDAGEPYVGPLPPDDYSVSQYGQVVFLGYVRRVTLVEDSSDSDVHTVEISGAQGHLSTLERGVENFWEQKDGVDHGGTFPTAGKSPMRIPDLIHHVVSHHTDWAEHFDLKLDFSTPRSASISLPEGQIMTGFQQWADGDFANCFVNRWGGLRYTSRPSFISQQWWTEAYDYAPLLTEIMNLSVSERNLSGGVTWVKLGGYGKLACAQFGEHPCGGPPQGSGGRWIFQQGLWYDDASTLCKIAAHLHAYENRRYDLALEVPYRPDLELGDLVRLPVADPSGRFDWRANPRLFEVTKITHEIGLARNTWTTSLQLEQVTYGLPCTCPRARCAQVVWDGTTRPDNPWPGDPDLPDIPGFPDFPGGGLDWPGFPGGPNGTPVIVSTVNGRVMYTSAGNGQFHEAWTDDISGHNKEFYTEKARGYKDWGRVTQAVALVVTVKGVGYQPLTIKVRPGTTTLGTTDIGDHVNYQHSSLPGSRADLFVLRIEPVDDLSAFLQETRETPIQGDGTGGPSPDGLDALPVPEGIDGDEVGGLGELQYSAEGYPILGTIPGTTLPYLGRYGAGMPEEGDAFWLSPLEHPLAQVAGVYIVAEGEGTAVVIGEEIGDGTGGPDPFGTGGSPFPVSTIPAIDPDAPAPRFGAGIGFTDPGGQDNIANTGWREYELYLSADETGRSYMIGFVVQSMAKESGDLTTIAMEDPINALAQPYVGLEIGVVRVDYDLVWGTPTYNPRTGLAFGGDASIGGLPDPDYGQENWPTLEAINARIAAAEQQTNHRSALDNGGYRMLTLGASYGVNPGLVLGLAYYQSHLGCDGSQLAVMFNNFFMLTGTGTCGAASLGDATGGSSAYAAYCTAEDGLDAGFDWVDAVRAQETVGGVLTALGMTAAQPTIEVLGASMGINLAAGAVAFSTPGGPATAKPTNGPGAGGYATMLEYALHQAGARLTQGPYEAPTHTLVDGYDLAVAEGTPLYPLLSGVVSDTGTDSTYGNYIDVLSTYGTIRYSHLSVVSVVTGLQVVGNTQIGESGNTGSSTGPHLHIELRGGGGLAAIMTSVGFNIGSFMP